MKRFKIRILFMCLVFLFSSCVEKGKVDFDDAISKIETKDYLQAERKLKLAIDKGYKKDKAEVVYAVVKTFNAANKYAEEEQFEKAEESLKKMPNSYKEYLISDDVDNLKEKITLYNEAYELYQKARNYYNNADYQEASNVIAIIKFDNLTSDMQQNLLQLEQDNKLQLTLSEKNKDYTYIKRIEDLMQNYAFNMTKSINLGDYRYVSTYILAGSDLSKDQKNLVKNLFEQGIEESVDSMSVDKINWSTDTDCHISTSESYYIYRPNGVSGKETYNFNYDIIEQDGHLYLTSISK